MGILAYFVCILYITIQIKYYLCPRFNGHATCFISTSHVLLHHDWLVSVKIIPPHIPAHLIMIKRFWSFLFCFWWNSLARNDQKLVLLQTWLIKCPISNISLAIQIDSLTTEFKGISTVLIFPHGNYVFKYFPFFFSNILPWHSSVSIAISHSWSIFFLSHKNWKLSLCMSLKTISVN